MTSIAFYCQNTEPNRAQTLARQAETLAAAGSDVTIFTPIWPELAHEISHSRIKIISMGKGAGKNFLSRLLFWLYAGIIISIAQFRRRYHLIQIQANSNIFVLTTYLAHFMGAKIVLNLSVPEPERLLAEENLRPNSIRVKAAFFVESIVVNYVDFIIAPSEPIRDKLINRGCEPDTINVIYQSPDDSFLLHSVRVDKHASMADRFLIISYSDGSETIDYETMLSALSVAAAKYPQILLWMVCPQEKSEEIKYLIRSKNITKNALLQTSIKDEEIPVYLAQADANIVALRRNPITDITFSQYLLQSMQFGIPTITTRTLLTSYYLDESVIQSFEEGAVSELANKITALYSDESRRLRMRSRSKDFITKIDWSRERHRYASILLTIAAEDTSYYARTPSEAAGFSQFARQQKAAAHAFRKASLEQILQDPFQGTAGGTLMQTPTSEDSAVLKALPLRISAPSKSWRSGRQARLTLSAWLLRISSFILLFSIPIAASGNNPQSKILAAALFVAVAVIALYLPPGESAIIVAFFYIAQRYLFLRFPPVGRLGPLFVYLGTVLQIIIFIGFLIRAIIQQRPLQRSRFILWPAALFIVVSSISAIYNRESFITAILGIEHLTHNLIFVILIAEDLPTPQQLQRYATFIILLITAFAAYSSGMTFLQPIMRPISVIEPDNATYGYLIALGLLLALGVVFSQQKNTNAVDENSAQLLAIVNSIGLTAAIAIMTAALFFTSAIEIWVGFIAGVVALLFILQSRLKLLLVPYLGVLSALSFVPFLTRPYIHTQQTYFQQFMAIFQGQFPHNTPLLQSLNVLWHNWLFGVGPGRFGGTVAYLVHSPVYAQYNIPIPYSTLSINLFWIHVFAETGIFGISFYIWLMFSTLHQLWLGYRRGSFTQALGITAGVFAITITFAIATFFGNALEADSLAAPFWGFIGIGVALPVVQTKSMKKEKYQSLRMAPKADSSPGKEKTGTSTVSTQGTQS